MRNKLVTLLLREINLPVYTRILIGEASFWREESSNVPEVYQLSSGAAMYVLWIHEWPTILALKYHNKIIISE